MEQAASTANAHCNVCNGTRTHIVLYREDTSWSEENGRYQGADTYETLKCAGCDAIKLRHHATYPSEPFESTTYFPAATFRRHPKWFHDLKFELLLDNDSVVDLLNEIYVALQHGLLRIAAMGVRALLERMMITKVGDKGKFSANIAAFEFQGYVSRIQRERLIAILDAGHAAIHRNYNPSKDDVITLLDITENLIETIYVHEAKVSALSARVPPRVPKVGA